MNCGDCIHYNSINATEGRCDKITYLGIVDVVDGSYNSSFNEDEIEELKQSLGATFTVVEGERNDDT